jgi:glutathione synthase/RimK-type ligase-like ATP-grasp enzyme
MPVIDDPISMIRCTNKVYLWERLQGAGLPAPETMIIQDKTDLEEVADRLNFPVVLKIPDGSFSRGIRKASSMQELREIVAQFLEDSDLCIAQKFVPTEFDWRVGVLDKRPLFVCQYMMARGHWQIIKHQEGAASVEGGHKAIPVAEAPADVVDVAVRAANLIGDGFYGVDLKIRPRRPHGHRSQRQPQPRPRRRRRSRPPGLEPPDGMVREAPQRVGPPIHALPPAISARS